MSYGAPPPPPGSDPGGYGAGGYGQPSQPGGYGAGGYGQAGGFGGGGQPPSNYLVLAIISILCCTPLGIASVVFSTQVNSKFQMGDQAGAEDASKKAKMFGIIGISLGGAAALIYLIFIIITVVAGIGAGTASTY